MKQFRSVKRAIRRGKLQPIFDLDNNGTPTRFVGLFYIPHKIRTLWFKLSEIQRQQINFRKYLVFYKYF
jgi:hypothetical protein